MLEMAMVVLFCLRHGYETISPRFSPQDIFEMIKLFTLNFFSISEQGWTEILKYAGIYERLLGPLLESVFTHRTEKQFHFTPAHGAELNRLLYPGPAQLEKMRFGSSRRMQVFPEPCDFDSDIFEYWNAMNSDLPGNPLTA